MNNKKIELIEGLFRIDDLIDTIGKKYCKEYAEILSGSCTNENTKRILETCSYNADARSLLRYSQDLILNWFVEDTIYEMIKNSNDFSCSLNGADKDRKFLTHSKVTGDVDIRLSHKNKDVYIEIVSDFYGFWNKNKVVHFRDNKLKKLIRLSEKNDLYVFALDFTHKKFGLIPIYNNLDATYIESHRAFGGKPAWELKLELNKFKNISLLGSENFLLEEIFLYP